MKTHDTDMNQGGHATAGTLDDLFVRGVGAGFFSGIDIHFARFIRRLCASVNNNAFLAAALVSKFTREGHICVDLAEHAGRTMVLSQQPAGTLECPGLDAWVEDLRACSVVGMPGDYTPMVLDAANRLYLWQYWDYEHKCADKLLWLGRQRKPFDPELFRKSLGRVFPSGDDDGTVEQKLCALVALRSGLCVITGGPGTGKTTLVSKILLLLVHQDAGLRIALAAPTGKAAHRVGEAVFETIERFDLPDSIKGCISHKASTIHRLLGIMPSRSMPRYHEENLLPYDVIVIDEASMVDLALMAKLLAAIKPSARLILVGDKNQLASVQAGHVLGDICDTGAVHGYSPGLVADARKIMGIEPATGTATGMQDSVVELSRTYRFSPDSGIYQLSRCVNDGDVSHCMDILTAKGCGDIRISETTEEGDLKEIILKAYTPALTASDPAECLRLFDSFRVLCALREGPFGVSRMNILIERALAEHGLIKPSAHHYHGRPVLVTANDYSMRMFNGDVGIILFDHDDHDLRAFFPASEGTPRKVSPVRLPQHETAFAMTVHKSQGSEFDHVLLVLPDRDSPVLSRELVYTGITRARNRLDIFLDRKVFAEAVTRRTKRTSGLRDPLWGGQ